MSFNGYTVDEFDEEEPRPIYRRDVHFPALDQDEVRTVSTSSSEPTVYRLGWADQSQRMYQRLSRI